MKQYCRYCAYALDYNGEGADFICDANAKCGNNGAGQFYNASKAKRPNKCPHFVFNEIDIFDLEKTYKPRKPYKIRTKQTEKYEQLSMECEIN